MLNLKTISAALLLGAFALASCDKEDDKKVTPAKQYSPEFSAKVNDTLWVAQGGSALKPRSNTGGLFSLQASDGAGKTIRLQSGGNRIKGVGTYTEVVGQFQYDKNVMDSDLYTSDFGGSCELIITKYDTVEHRISGTFNFSAPGYLNPAHKEVTEGKFKDILFQ